MEFLNSPFFLTFLGSLIIGMVTIVVEARISNASKVREHAKDIRQAKIRLLADLAQHASRCLTLLQSLKKRQIWLKENKETADDGLTYPDGRTFEETRVEYEKAIDSYYSNTTLEALLLQAAAMASERGVKDGFRRVLCEYEKSMATFSSEDFAASIPRLRSEIAELLTQFSNEIE